MQCVIQPCRSNNVGAKVFCAVFLALLSSLNPSYVQGDPFDAKIIRELAQAEVERQKIPGLTLAISIEGKIVFEEGYGWADVEHRVPAKGKTVFRTASIAKPMTSTVILKLAEQGKLDLDEDVHQYYPTYPEKMWPVTSRQLLGHLSGVRHYKSREEASSTKHFFNTKSTIEIFADDPLRHEPGSKFLYSSFGYNLLGAIAEGAGGQPFVKQLQRSVFRVAKMNKTRVDDSFVIIPDRARGYMRLSAAQVALLPAGHGYEPGKLYNSSLHDTSMKIPGGGLVSTSADLCRFANALHGGKLLEEASLKAMWTSQQTTEGKPTGYGLGWTIHDDGAISHGGGQSGTSTFLVHDPRRNIAVAAMCNLQGAKLSTFCRDLLKKVATGSVKEVREKLRAAIEREVEAKQLPAISIALVDGGKTIYADGFGFVDAKRKKPATADTVYRVGSVSKLFTDIAVMQLVEKGEMDLDADVRNLLPEFQPDNPDGTPLTLRMLMSHRSGLVRESPVGHYFDPKEPSLADTIASLNDTSLTYPPETKTKYSNAGVSVAGFALQKKTKTRFEEYLKSTLLTPMKMKDSAFERTPHIDGKLADAFMWTVDGRRFAAPKFALGTAPAGSLYANVNDLAKFIKVILNDGKSGKVQVIQAESLKRMMEPSLDKDGKPLPFGIGFGLSNFDGQPSIGHGGAVYGFSTQFRVLPESKLGVAAATSLDGANGVVRRLSDYGLRLLLAQKAGEPLPEYQHSKPIDDGRRAELVGLYKSKDGEPIRLSERSGKVFLRKGAYRREIRQIGDRLVPDDVHGYGPVWEPTGAGELAIGDKTFQRIPDQLPAAVPDRWRGLIGEYGWDHNTLYIFEDHGQLYALIEWFYYYPLTEVSESVFAFPDFGLYHGEQLIFERGADPLRRAKRVEAAEVVFERRSVGPEDGATFKIEPLRPVSELLKEAQAAKPHDENGAFLRSELVDVAKLENSIKLDIRYATTNNFMDAVFYAQPRAFMQRPAAEAVVKAHHALAPQGLGLLIHDAYRPWYVTKTFWDATPGSMRDFVANPENGSRHNRGCAVDLTLYYLDSGKPVRTVAGYDEFSQRSFPPYPGGTSRERWYRELLRKTMQDADFTIYEYEWWHFDYKDWQRYKIGNQTFEQIDP